MCLVWNAPATGSGRSRAPSGGSSWKVASSSIVPAATIWPAPLMLAGVRLCFSIAEMTASWSPPSTAVMPVSVTAAAAAMALPRSRTKTIACSADMTPAAAAAVISPTEWPAPTPTLPKASAGCGNRLSSETSPDATSSGWAIGGVANRVGVRLGAVVHEVEVGDGGEPSQSVLEAGQLEPGGEEAGSLGPLAWGDDDEHVTTLAYVGGISGTGADERMPALVVGTLQRCGGRARPVAPPSGRPAG